MTNNRATTSRAQPTRETVPQCWTELDARFFALVGDLLSTSFLWGAATLLASYDPDDGEPAATALPRRDRPTASMPSQRTLAA